MAILAETVRVAGFDHGDRLIQNIRPEMAQPFEEDRRHLELPQNPAVRGPGTGIAIKKPP
jgi:hypothetical protein